MSIIGIVMFIYIALIILFVSKAVKASVRRKTTYNRTSRPQNASGQKQYTYSQPVRKTTNTGSEYINSERKKEFKKKPKLFSRREPDCDLDERYFGSKNENKDLW